MSALITIGQIFDRTLERYREHFKELFGISLWVLVAFVPLGVASFLNPVAGEALTRSRAIFLWLLNAGSILAVTVLSLWVGISLIYAVAQAESGKRVDTHDIGKRAWKIFIPFALLSILVGLIALGIASLVIPGFLLTSYSTLTNNDGVGPVGLLLFFAGAIASLILLIKLGLELSFAQYVFLLEPKGKPLAWSTMKAALKSSRALVRGRWWATMFRLVLPSLVFSLVVFGANYAVSIGGGILLAIAASDMSVVVLKLGAVLISFLVVGINTVAMPLFSIATYTLYDSLTSTRGRTS